MITGTSPFHTGLKETFLNMEATDTYETARAGLSRSAVAMCIAEKEIPTLHDLQYDTTDVAGCFFPVLGERPRRYDVEV